MSMTPTSLLSPAGATGAERVQRYPDGFWNRLVFSQDGKTIASAGSMPARLWSAATGKLVRTISPDNTLSLAYSPDKRTMALGGVDGRVRLGDVVTGRVLRTFAGQRGEIGAVVYSPDGLTLASASADGTVRLWDVRTGAAAVTLTEAAPVRSVLYSPDGQNLATTTSSGTIRIWRSLTGAPGPTLARDAGQGITLAFTPDGQEIAAGLDGSIGWWETATGRKVGAIGQLGPVAGLAFSPDGRTLVFTQSNDTVSVWDTRSRRVVTTFDGQSETTAEGVAFAADGSRFATFSGPAGPIRFWRHDV